MRCPCIAQPAGAAPITGKGGVRRQSRQPVRWPALAALLFWSWTLAAPEARAEAPPRVRVAVVGGLVLCGVWPELSRRAAAATGLEIETVAAAPKEGIVPAFRQGEAELLLMHGSDETYHLQAAGLAAPLQAWAMNEHVILGPPEDPARIAQAPDAATALARIIEADAPMIGFRDPGSLAVMHALFRARGLRPGIRQQLPDTGATPQQVLESAAAQGAYVIAGHIPVAFGKMPQAGLALLFSGDPAMRRVYVLVQPGPRHPASPEQRQRARQLADYLQSPAGRQALEAANQSAGSPWVFPLPE